MKKTWNSILIIIIGIAILFSPLLCMAENAKIKGQVRTIERPDKKSEGLNGVIISIIEAPNTVLSNKLGNFIVVVPGIKEEGDPYTIGNVRKNNYVLVDKAVRGRKYGYSSKVPLEIVMVSRHQLDEDRRRIEDMAVSRAEKEYKEKINELERKYQTKSLSDEEYAKECMKYRDDYDKYMSLIEKMAEIYALTDYKNISKLDKQIQQAIENAELEKAESLLRSKGDCDKSAEEAKQLIEIGEKTKREGIEKLNEVALDYYYWSAIYTGKYQFDKAANSLEKRAKLDSLNVEWQLDYANYLSEYLADYEKAEYYARKALRLVTEAKEPNNLMIASCLNDLAVIVSEAGHYDSGLEIYKKSIELCRNLYGEESEEIAKCYSEMSAIYLKKDEFDIAKDYAEKALHLRQALSDKNDCAKLALSYADIGKIEKNIGNYLKALEYFQLALPIILECKGEENQPMAELCAALGATYVYLDRLNTALSWYERALNIERKLYGDEHPMVATVLDNMGWFYSNIMHYKESYEYHQKALNMRLKTLGKYHPEIGHSYNNIAAALYHLDKFEEAYEYMEKALELDRLIYGEKSSYVARDYSNMSVHLSEKGKYDEALELINKSLSIFTAIYGRHSASVAHALGNIADIYAYKKDYQLAIEYNLQAADIYKVVNGEQNSGLINVYNNQSEVYREMGDYKKQIDYLQRSIEIIRKVYGDESAPMGIAYSNLSMAYMGLEDYDMSIQYVLMSMVINTKIYGESSNEVLRQKQILGSIYDTTKDYVNAIRVYSELLPIYHNLYGDNARKVIGISQELYLNYNILLKNNPTSLDIEKFQQFMSDKIWTITPTDDGVALQKGMKGINYLLQYCDWNIDSDNTANFIEEVEKKRQSTKHIIVMTPEGKIETYDFEEETVGVQFVLQFISPADKQRMIDTWKNM